VVRLRIPAYLYGSLAALVLCVAATFLGIAAVEGRPSVVSPGVSVHGIELGGMTAPECLETIAALEAQLRASPITLTLGERVWQVELGALGLRLDGELITARAMEAGNSGFYFSRVLERRRIAREGLVLLLEARLEEECFRQVVGELTADLTRPPVDAKYHIGEDDTVRIIPHQDGYQVDFDRLEAEILAQLDQGTGGSVLTVPLIHIAPKYTTRDIEAMGLTGLLSVFSTDYDPSAVNRAYNISVAASALNNLLVAPGETVSFNRIVGPRSSEEGYRTAPVIIENELREGLGGGVCQVSTTLYNAVLLADLEVLERKNHSLPVSYVPVGQDATVVYGAIDLRFRNNTDSYLYIKTSAADGRITVKIFGNHHNHPRVEIKSVVIETIDYRTIYEEDENLEAGKEVVKQVGVRGYRARTERWIWRNGNVEKEELPSSFYHPVPEIIAVGTREVPAVVVLPGGDETTESPTAGQDPRPPEGNNGSTNPSLEIPLEFGPRMGDGDQETRARH
jgi:vancomycin resistance protein YoaR